MKRYSIMLRLFRFVVFFLVGSHPAGCSRASQTADHQWQFGDNRNFLDEVAGRAHFQWQDRSEQEYDYHNNAGHQFKSLAMGEDRSEGNL